MQGQGAELHCLSLKMGHFIPGVQKQKGLVAIHSSLRASLAASEECLRQRLKQRDRSLILEGRKGLGSGDRAGYKGCRSDRGGFG